MKHLDNYVAISALQHFRYCERKCALVVVDDYWQENVATTRGQLFHRKVDAGKATVNRTGRAVLRNLRVWSDRLRLIGRIDACEVSLKEVVPVEYKAGYRLRDTADVQLCAQALCLEEMFEHEVPHGFLWLGKTRRKSKVVFGPELRSVTEETIEQVHQLRKQRFLPPAVNDSRCGPCQFRDICLPQVTSEGTDPSGAYVESLFSELDQ